MNLGGIGRPTRAQLVVGAATALAYLIGYPLGIVGGYTVGWVLVSLGGLLLLVLVALTIRRVHRGAERDSEP